jgi:hypothetical protein
MFIWHAKPEFIQPPKNTSNLVKSSLNIAEYTTTFQKYTTTLQTYIIISKNIITNFLKHGNIFLFNI